MKHCPKSETGMHIKVYSNKQLLSNPPQQKWICKLCGKKRIERRGKYLNNGESYDDIVRRFKLEKKNKE